eukprot:Skav200010  [mRNA]  locus=scaffold1637:38030:42457:- [translate_table: standard]
MSRTIGQGNEPVMIARCFMSGNSQNSTDVDWEEQKKLQLEAEKREKAKLEEEQQKRLQKEADKRLAEEHAKLKEEKRLQMEAEKRLAEERAKLKEEEQKRLQIEAEKRLAEERAKLKEEEQKRLQIEAEKRLADEKAKTKEGKRSEAGREADAVPFAKHVDRDDTMEVLMYVASSSLQVLRAQATSVQSVMSSDSSVKQELLSQMDGAEGGSFGVAHVASAVSLSKVPRNSALPPDSLQQSIGTAATYGELDTYHEEPQAGCASSIILL